MPAGRPSVWFGASRQAIRSASDGSAGSPCANKVAETEAVGRDSPPTASALPGRSARIGCRPPNEQVSATDGAAACWSPTKRGGGRSLQISQTYFCVSLAPTPGYKPNLKNSLGLSKSHALATALAASRSNQSASTSSARAIAMLSRAIWAWAQARSTWPP